MAHTSYVHDYHLILKITQWNSWHSPFLFSTHPRTHFHWPEKGREGRREGRGEREKHRLIASYICPDLGSNPQPRYVSWLVSPQCMEWHSNQLSWASRAIVDIFISILHIRTLRLRELSDLLKILKLERAELGWFLDQSRSRGRADEAPGGRTIVPVPP